METLSSSVLHQWVQGVSGAFFTSLRLVIADQSLKVEKRPFSWSDLNEIELTVIGRKSGKPLPRPVWFAIRGKEMLLMPVQGNDTEWYKNVLREPRVTITSEEHTLKGKLQTITQKSRVDDVITLFEKKYGQSDIKKYYPKRNVAASLSLK